MSKIFGILAAVFLAASAFVAWKNQEAYQEQIKTLHTSKNLKASTQKDLAKQLKRLKDTKTAKAKYIAEKVEVDKELEIATAQYDKIKKMVNALKNDHRNQEAEIANADEILADLPDPDELVPKVKRMRAELAEATSDLATEEAKLANLTRQDESGKERITAIRMILSNYSSGKSLPSLSTRISAIYRNWGFVILSGGNEQGVVSGSILNVMRGRKIIGKLKVTAVEAGRASADIILTSVTEGTSLQSGDKVVAEQEVGGKSAPARK